MFRVRLRRAQPTRQQAFTEVGTTGLRRYGGYVYEEWLRQLSGRRGAWKYREMADNDPVIGAILFAIEMLARRAPVHVQDGKDPRATELIETCMEDMSHTWPDFVAEVFSMLTYGWELNEIVYKRRQGPDNAVASRYTDGLIGWRKLPTRAQETLEHWEFADDGGLESMVQVAYDGVRRTIPIEKALLFRTTPKRGNPEGRSILRNAYIPATRKTDLEEIEAIGIERDVAGLPVLTPPDGVDLEAPGNENLKAAAQDLVTGIRKDEDAGVVLPSDGWKLELLKAAGASSTDPDKTIRRYDQRIAQLVLADFIQLGSENVGSFALGKVKIDTFGQAMQAWLESIAAVMNRYAIPRLLRLNGMKVDDPPKIAFGDVGQVDAQFLAEFLNNLHLAGMPIDWSYDLAKALFKAAGLPEPEESPTGVVARGGAATPYDEEPVKPEPDPPVEGEPAAPEPTDDELATAASGKGTT